MTVHPRRSGARLRATISLYALALAGCGYIGDPLPPLLNIPARVNDLAAVQRGGKLIVQFTLPRVTTEGSLIKGDIRAELHGGTADQPFQADAWAASSKAFGGATSAEGHERYEIPSAEWTGKDVIFGAKVIGANGRDAGWSNFVVLSVVPPPEKPAGLRAEPVPSGVRLTWQARGPAFRVFRKAGQETAWSLAASTEKPEWTDTATEYGKPYEYMVQTLVKAGSGTAESDLSDVVRVTPADTFPPAVPKNLTAIPSTATIELTWDRDTEADLAGYRVYRASGNGAFERLAEVPDTPTFSDNKIHSGELYRYAVSAFDRSGNESPRSVPVAVTAP